MRAPRGGCARSNETAWLHSVVSLPLRPAASAGRAVPGLGHTARGGRLHRRLQQPSVCQRVLSLSRTRARTAALAAAPRPRSWWPRPAGGCRRQPQRTSILGWATCWAAPRSTACTASTGSDPSGPHARATRSRSTLDAEERTRPLLGADELNDHISECGEPFAALGSVPSGPAGPRRRPTARPI